TTTPEKVMVYADFMHRTGAIKAKPASWKDLCHETVHGKPGS
ncbi:MAG: ABC transporter substrate-binding protein, partial [Hyphomicrobiaceae bacterium]